MSKSRLSWIAWYPEDILGGCELLEPDVELAYRRILDYLVVTKDELPDDDRKLSRLTKTGRKWKRIKAELLEANKIYIENKFIRNDRMSKIIAEALESSRKQAERGAAGAAARWNK